jgi:hypothetical protein
LRARKELPYDFDSLLWDESHQRNDKERWLLEYNFRRGIISGYTKRWASEFNFTKEFYFVKLQVI